MSDPIADLMIRINNCRNAGMDEVLVPYSAMKLAILNVMIKYDLIASAEVKSVKNLKKILVKFGNNKLSHFKRISKPGRKYYSKASEIPKPLSGMGLIVISTSQGIMSGFEARKKKIGGELICEAW